MAISSWASGPWAESCPSSTFGLGGGLEQAAGARDEGYNGGAVISGVWCPGTKGQGWQGREKGQEDAGPVLEASNSEALVQRGVMVCRLEALLGGEQGRAGPVEEVEETETLDRPGGTSRQPRPTQPCPVQFFSAGTAHSLNLNTPPVRGSSTGLYRPPIPNTHTASAQLQLAV